MNTDDLVFGEPKPVMVKDVLYRRCPILTNTIFNMLLFLTVVCLILFGAIGLLVIIPAILWLHFTHRVEYEFRQSNTRAGRE